MKKHWLILPWVLYFGLGFLYPVFVELNAVHHIFVFFNMLQMTVWGVGAAFILMMLAKLLKKEISPYTSLYIVGWLLVIA